MSRIDDPLATTCRPSALTNLPEEVDQSVRYYNITSGTNSSGTVELEIHTGPSYRDECRVVPAPGPVVNPRRPLTDAERKHRRRLRAIAKASRRRNR